MRKLIYSPSSDLCDIEVGQIFQHEPSGKFYQLLDRNAIHALVKRWTWWDDFKLYLRGAKNGQGRGAKAR